MRLLRCWWVWASGGAALALLLVAGAVAAEGLTPADTTLPDSVLEARLRFIEERLEERRLHGQIWYWGWMAVNGGAAVGLGILAGLSDDRDDTVNNAVTAGIAALGVADLVFRPLEARLGAAPIRALPADTREEKIEQLQRAEALLQANAERAAERTSWSMHLANLGLNAAAGVVIGVLGDPKDAAISAGSNFLGGIAYLLTEPAGPADDWQAYRAMVAGHSAAAPELRLTLTAYGGGGGLRLNLLW